MQACARPRAPPWPVFASRRSCRRCSPSFRPSYRLVTGAWYLKERPVLQAQRAQLAAPYASAVQRRQLAVQLEAERGPVAEDDRLPVIAEPEPGGVARRGRLAFGLELHLALRTAKAQARHRVHDDAEPV